MTERKKLYEQWAAECEKAAEWWASLGTTTASGDRYYDERDTRRAAELRAEAARWRKLAELE